MQSIMKISLEQAKRAARLCFLANIVFALWGRRGVGKSSSIQQAVPAGWGFYDFRASDKEAPDIGGIPYPTETVSTGRKAARRVEYLMSNLLPFDTEEKCVVLFDEFDRTSDLSVQNAMLQLILDRKINGHHLSPNARIAIAGNGATDIGTIPLSKAAAGRMLHLYIATDGQAALDAWTGWATDAKWDIPQLGEMKVSPALQSFATYKQDVWTDASDAGELEEYGSPTPRTFVMADTIYQVARDKARFETADIILPCLAGCVGTAAAREMLGWYKVCEQAPTIDEIKNNPKSCRLPNELGVYFALGMTLARIAATLDTKSTDAIATYVSRWTREQAKFAFTHILKEQPRVATSAAYMQWIKS